MYFCPKQGTPIAGLLAHNLEGEKDASHLGNRHGGSLARAVLRNRESAGSQRHRKQDHLDGTRVRGAASGETRASHTRTGLPVTHGAQADQLPARQHLVDYSM